MRGSLIVDFDTADGGLSTRDNESPRGFAIAGADGKYAYAEATIKGKYVILNSDSVPRPETVRYAWTGVPDSNLTDRSRLPAAPFRTDVLSPPEAEIQRRPVARQVRMKMYEAIIDGNGSISSLGIGGKQFMSNALGLAGGTTVPGWFGPRDLSDVRELGPGRVLCGDSEVEVLYDFSENEMDWTITNRSGNGITFRIALNPKVSIMSMDKLLAVSASRGSATLGIMGVTKISQTEDGPVLEVSVGPRLSHTVKLRVGN